MAQLVMQSCLKDDDVPQREAWILLAILLVLVEVSGWVLVGSTRMFPAFSLRFSGLYLTTLTDVLIFGYCVNRFGGIKLVEIFPKGKDFVVLGLAGLFVFGYFGLTVGPGGMTSGSYDAIRDLPRYAYWLSVVNIILVGPFFEETIFRRYFLEILAQHHSTAIAVIITAGAATCFHYGLPLWSLIFIFFVQLLLGVVYVLSRLGGSIGIHIFLNSLILLLSK